MRDEKPTDDNALILSAEGIVSSIMAAGPQKYGLQIEPIVLQDIISEVRSDKYITDIKNNIKNLSNKMLEAMIEVTQKIIDDQDTHKETKRLIKQNKKKFN